MKTSIKFIFDKNIWYQIGVKNKNFELFILNPNPIIAVEDVNYLKILLHLHGLFQHSEKFYLQHLPKKLKQVWKANY